jgi:methionyl-tRNA formyltransferase
VAYGRIIPQEIIDIFPHGIINIHPSLLPKYRGPTPIEQAILEGVTETGTSIMQLVSKMDAGPVFAQETVKLSDLETKEQLATRLLNLGGELLLGNLPSILDGTLKPMSQNESEVSYTNLISKDDGNVNFEKPAEQLEREIRAYYGWPRSRAKIFDKETVINKARIARNSEDGSLVIACKQGYLEIEELVAPSGRTVTGAEFLRGYKKISSGG